MLEYNFAFNGWQELILPLAAGFGTLLAFFLVFMRRSSPVIPPPRE